MAKFLRLLAITFGIACIIGLVTSSIGWFLGWKSSTEFSNGLFWVGAILAIFGYYSYSGNYDMRRNLHVHISQAAGNVNIFERTKRWLIDTEESYNFFFFLFRDRNII